jgi:hypothetical protein
MIMRKKLLTKHCAMMLLALLAAAWSTHAWAITINVSVTGNQAPYVYAWDNNQTMLLGDFPGTQLTTTRTVGGETFYYINIDASSVNIIISNGGSDTQTSDITGLTKTKYFRYFSGDKSAYDVTDYFDYPNGVSDENDNYAYLVNVSRWDNVYAYVYDDDDNKNEVWPGEKMTKVGTNSNGFDVYKWTGTIPAEPLKIVFNSGSDTNKTENLDWTNGGCYSNYQNGSRQGAVTGVLLDSDHFPDVNMRNAIGEITGVQENGIITTKNRKVLDLSNKGITNLEGVANFANLEELYVQDNNLTSNVDLKNNKKLQILNISGNSAITGFSANHTPYVDINFGNGSPTTNLKELYCANCAIFYAGGLQYNVGLKVLSMPHNVLDYFDATNTMSKLSNLEYLDMSYNKLTSQQSLSHNPKLVYVDVSENPTFNSYFAHLENLTQLKTFKAANCKLTADQTKYSNTYGYFPNESVEYVDVSNNPALNTMYVPATNNLKTIIANGCTGLGGSSSSLALSPTSGGTYLPRLTHLEHLELNNVDLYLNTSNQTYGLFNILTPSVATNLNYIDLSNDQLGTSSKPTFAFPKLETLLLNGNPNLTSVTVTDLESPDNFQLNVTDDAALSTIAINNSGLDESHLPTIIGWTCEDATLKYNSNNFTSIPSVFDNVAYLYLQENAFSKNLILDGDNIALKGIALSNKSSVSPIKTFTASVASITPDEWDIDYTVTPPVTILANADENDGSNTTLECINLNGNTALETVTVNGFKGLTKLASDNDMTTDKGKGLYVKGNTSIKNLDISNNRFEILGQDNSLNGLFNLEMLNASHNKIMTLTNRSAISGATNPRAAYGNGTYTSATCPNIEDLTGLKDLNLSYNLLSDSIHLWKNIALERLDVTHNRTITERNAGEILYYRDTKDGSFKQWKETSWKTVKDMYTNDLNDTIGLRMLDLWHNTNLKYLDISYTNIENTALNWSYVNNRVGPENLQRGATDPTTGVIIGQSGIPRFVLVNHCPELIEFRTNYNAMKSLGVGHAVESGPYPVTGCPKLEHLEAIECRGQDPYIMQGEITLSVYNPLLKYYNVSNSNFDKVNPYTNNEHGMSGQNLETLIVDGNYTRDNATAWNLTNAGTLDVSNNPKLVNLQANKCPNLETVKANHLDYLDIISLTQDTTVTTINNENVTTKLANLYVDHDAILDEVLGLETLSALSVYHANDSHFTGDFVMPAQAKATLTDLRVGNEALSLASTRNNLTTVNLAGYSAVKHLETQNNPQVEALDILGFTTTLEHINFANNHIDNSGIGITAAGLLPSLPALKYFNCSNDSKWTADAGNRLTDLILTNSTRIKEIYGNNNDLHCITGSFANLTNIEFAHNHINGIDLSAAPNANVNSEDNGRTIVADCSKFTHHGDFGNVVTVYFFQLDDLSNAEVQNGTQLTKKDSEDSNHKIRYLDEDGLDLTKIVNWISDAAVLTNSSNSKNVTLDPSNMSQYLNPKDVPGTIVVLKAANETANGAEGQATYTYNTGNGGSVFYLNWSSDGTITGINSVIGDSDFDLAGTYGGIVVAGKDGTVVGVYDLNGRQVASETISNGKVVITGLAPGIYVVNGNKVLVK